MASLNQENAAADLNLDIVLPYFLPLSTLKAFVGSNFLHELYNMNKLAKFGKRM